MKQCMMKSIATTVTAAIPSLGFYPFSHCQVGQNTLTMEEITSELLPVREAQKLKVHKFPKFFSDEDIQTVLEFKRKHDPSLGKARRDSKGIKALDSTWVTTYLSTDNLFVKVCPDLVDRLVNAALEADEMQNWGILNNSKYGSWVDGQNKLNIRVIELHDVDPGGALSDPTHCDGGSLVTLDIMFSAPGDFRGGTFVTPEYDGILAKHSFEQGDLIVFPSHKYHYVEPVTTGHRRVMVMEIWRGKTRSCAHRCLQHLGECHYTNAMSKVDNLLQASFPEVDPW